METPTLDPTQESLDEKRFREVAVAVTAAGLAAEEAVAARNLYNFEHPLKTLPVQAHLAELQSEVERTEAELQKLLPLYSESKARVQGW